MVLRASLVHHESLIRFQESSKFFLETNLGPLKARAGEVAAVIDQLNHCSVTEIPLLSTLTNATRAFNEPFSTLPAGQAPALATASASDEVTLPGMRDPFIFASGAGAWRTMVTIHPDGTLEGAYLDANAGDAGNEYPNGTRWECHFTGKFQAIEKVGEFEFAMTLEDLQYEEEPDAERIVDGVRIIATEPYGLEGTGQFRLYLPGMPTSALSDEFLTWYGNIKGWADVPDVLPDYGLYNVSELYGFSPFKMTVTATGKDKGTYEVDKTLLDRIYNKFGEICETTGASVPAFETGSHYFIKDPQAQVFYYFSAKDRTPADSDLCYKIQAPLKTIVPDLDTDISLEDFTSQLMSASGKASFTIRDGSGTAASISSKYAQISFGASDGSGGDGSMFGAAILVDVSNGLVLSPDSVVWLVITAG